MSWIKGACAARSTLRARPRSRALSPLPFRRAFYRFRACLPHTPLPPLSSRPEFPRTQLTHGRDPFLPFPRILPTLGNSPPSRDKNKNILIPLSMMQRFFFRPGSLTSTAYEGCRLYLRKSGNLWVQIHELAGEARIFNSFLKHYHVHASQI